jgi:hypothetical protein
MDRYKCHTCKTVLSETDLVDKKCPICNESHLAKMCPLDHCHCTHSKPMDIIAYCEKCGAPICPECGTHDVAQISRVTGYLQDVAGWNSSKKQELKDRHRTTNEELK